MRIGFVVAVLVFAVLAWQVVEQKAEAKPHKVRMIKQQPMDDIRFEMSDVLYNLNTIRGAMSMPPLQENKALAQAAQSHADYLVDNHISSHHEIKGSKGFTGEQPIDRALKAGYKARFIGENLSTSSKNSHDSLDGLFSAIYHRFGFLSPVFDEIGVGISQDKKNARNNAFVYLMGNSEVDQLCRKRPFTGSGNYVIKACSNTKHRISARAYKKAKTNIEALSPPIIIYPYDGQKEVPPAFYNEHPDPLPDYDVSGFPVSIEFNEPIDRRIKLLSFRLYEKNSGEVKNVRLMDAHNDPNKKFKKHQFALFPLERLKYNTEYMAKVKYSKRGKTHKLNWQFSTIEPPEELVVVREKHESITLKAGKSYWLYFVPHDPHDAMKTMQFPEDMYVRFVDNNTMRVVIEPERSRGFDIKGGDRELHVDVE